MAETITVKEFQSRLRVWCREDRSYHQLPSKRKDRWILFYSLVRAIDELETFDEPAINEQIRQWLAGIGKTLEIDPVSIRRELVDGGFLERDPAGSVYRKSTRYRRTFDFENGIEDLDLECLVRAGSDR